MSKRNASIWRALTAIDNHSHFHYVRITSPEPEHLPMYVCICRGVTDSQIRRAVDEGAASLSQVRRQLAVAACCGRCAPMARDIIRERSQAAGLSAAVPSTLI